MKNWKIVTVLLLSLVLTGSISCNALRGPDQGPSQQLDKVTRGDLTVTVSGSGSIEASRQLSLSFGSSGRIDKIYVEEGDKVSKGDVLATLDTTPLEEMVTTAELAVKAAEIDLELATNNYLKLITPYPYLTYRFVLPESVDAIRTAEQQIKEAQTELLKGLQGQPYSMAEIQDQLGKAQESLSEAETKLAWGFDEGVRPVGIEYWTLRAAQLQMEKAQVALDNTKNELNKVQDQLEKAVIVAPFAGVVTSIDAEEGDTVATTVPIIYLMDPTSKELVVEVDETDVTKIEPEQRAIIEADALPDLNIEGKVSYTSPVARYSAGLMLYEVKIYLDVPDGSQLRVGMSASADIAIEERANVLLVPNQAIKRDNNGNTIVEVMVGEQIQERPVATGISDGSQTEILSGLSEGEVVVK